MAETFECLPRMPEVGGTVPETVERSLELFGEFPVVRQKKVVVLLPATAMAGQGMTPAPERPFPGRRPVGGACPQDPAVDQVGFQVHDVPAGIALDADMYPGRLAKKPETLVVFVPDLDVIPVQPDGDSFSCQNGQCPGNSPVGKRVHGDVDGMTGCGQGPDVEGFQVFLRGVMFPVGKGRPQAIGEKKRVKRDRTTPAKKPRMEEQKPDGQGKAPVSVETCSLCLFRLR